MYVIEWTTTGTDVVQIERETGGSLLTSVSIPGMRPVAVSRHSRYGWSGGENELIRLDYPAGMKVRITSEAAVTACKVLTADGVKEMVAGTEDPLDVGGDVLLVNEEDELLVEQ